MMLHLNELSLIFSKPLKTQTGLASVETKKFYGNKAFLDVVSFLWISVYIFVWRILHYEIFISPDHWEVKNANISTLATVSKDSKSLSISNLMECLTRYASTNKFNLESTSKTLSIFLYCRRRIWKI